MPQMTFTELDARVAEIEGRLSAIEREDLRPVGEDTPVALLDLAEVAALHYKAKRRETLNKELADLTAHWLKAETEHTDDLTIGRVHIKRSQRRQFERSAWWEYICRSLATEEEQEQVRTILAGKKIEETARKSGDFSYVLDLVKVEVV